MISPTAPVYQEYVDTYVAAARDLPFVDRIYVDTSDGLTIFTIYHGSLYEIGSQLMDASGRAMDCFPRTPVDFRFLEMDGGIDAELASADAVCVFSAQ